MPPGAPFSSPRPAVTFTSKPHHWSPPVPGQPLSGMVAVPSHKIGPSLCRCSHAGLHPVPPSTMCVNVAGEPYEENEFMPGESRTLQSRALQSRTLHRTLCGRRPFFFSSVLAPTAAAIPARCPPLRSEQYNPVQAKLYGPSLTIPVVWREEPSTIRVEGTNIHAQTDSGAVRS